MVVPPQAMTTRVSSLALFSILFMASASIGYGQGPNRWAVVVGVSKFQKLDAAQQLEFADKDAEAFAKFIASPRGRGFPKDNVKLLVNEQATTSQLRTSLAQWLKRNSKAEDMIYIFLATH